MRSFPLVGAGRTGSRPDLRLRYLRVGESLPMGHPGGNGGLLAGAIRNRLRLDPALARDAPRGRQPLEPIHRRSHHVVRIGRAEALRQDVADPRALEHRAHRTTGDHAGSRRGGLEQHAARAVLADDLVRNRSAGERDFVHAAARRLDGFAHRLADLVRLAGRDPDLPFVVADGHERVEAEAPAALHDLRHAIDRDDVLDYAVAVALTTAVALAPVAATSPAATTTSTPAPAPAPATATATGSTRGPLLLLLRLLCRRGWDVSGRDGRDGRDVRRSRRSLARGNRFVFRICP